MSYSIGFKKFAEKQGSSKDANKTDTYIKKQNKEK